MPVRATLRAWVPASLLVVIALAGPVPTAAAEPAVSATETAASTPPVSTPDAVILAAVEQGVANAAAQDVRQGVAVIDRSTGLLVADVGGREVFNTESITKLFTAAYYLEQSQGAPDADLAADLARMIATSDNDVQFALWRRDIVPTVAQRYALTASTNAPGAGGGNWGSNRTTANDMVTFLLRASRDPWVGPLLLSWMAQAQPTGTGGFDQAFGLFSLAGDRGVKQGWSDVGWEPANLHSVGWTDRSFVAILQSSYSADNDTMRATSTLAAQLIDGAHAPAARPAAQPSPAADDPAPTVRTDPSVPAATSTEADAPPARALGRSVLQIVEDFLLRALLG
jgi:hypothetical protein